jgi:hypothetical protein
MASLASHLNVWGTCLEILHRRGWKLRRILSPTDDGQDTWEAVLGDIDLVADNPIELLGLAAIHDEIRPEKHEPYWWVVGPAEGEERVYDRLLEEAIATQEARVEGLRRLRETDPEAWREELRFVLENSGSADDAAAQLGVPTIELRRLLPDPLVATYLPGRGWR